MDFCYARGRAANYELDLSQGVLFLIMERAFAGAVSYWIFSFQFNCSCVKMIYILVYFRNINYDIKCNQCRVFLAGWRRLRAFITINFFVRCPFIAFGEVYNYNYVPERAIFRRRELCVIIRRAIITSQDCVDYDTIYSNGITKMVVAPRRRFFGSARIFN